MFGQMWNNITQSLIDKIIQYDEHAFGEFYLHTIDMFYRFAKSHYQMSEDDIQQLLSELYIKIWQNLPSYDPHYKFETRCWTLYRNLLKDWFKKLKEYHFADLNYQDWPDWEQSSLREEKLESDDEHIVDILDRQFAHDRIIVALQQLDLAYAEVIHLRYVEQKNYEEIAELCDLSIENVRQRISRWLKKLKSQLEESE